LQTPPPFRDFEQWIDTEIKEDDKRLLQGLKEWDGERAGYWRRDAERRLYKRSTRKRRKGGVLLRTGRRGRRGLSVFVTRKAAMEENPDALRKGKWSRCTQ
jgi:hypothetical protein